MFDLHTRVRWNSKPVVDKVRKSKIQYHRSAGAVTSTIARRKVKKRPLRAAGGVTRDSRGMFQSVGPKTDVSPPGEPPTNRTGKYKNGILFAYDERTDSTVIGPTAVAGERTAILFERGGIYTLKNFKGQSRRGRMKPRPVMTPTADDARPYYGGGLLQQLRF